MFEHASNLEEVIFCNEVNSIEASAFNGCGSLKRIVFAHPVKQIDRLAFPNIEILCFYGEVDSVRASISGVKIYECKEHKATFKNNCNRLNGRSGLVLIFLLLA